MPHCMVPLCTNAWRKTKRTDIIYHRLPTGALKAIWLKIICRDNTRNASHAFVCIAHFTPDCFDSAAELCGRKKPRTLKSCTVPTLFVFVKKENAAHFRSLRQIRERVVGTVFIKLLYLIVSNYIILDLLKIEII